jgi:thioredoxin-related protein
MSLSISLPVAFAEDRPAEPTPAADSTESTKVEVRDVAQFFDESFNDMQEEIETAKTDGKKGLLIMFEMDECPFCHRMKTTVLNRSDIQDYYKENFRIVSVDIEGDVEMTNFKGDSVPQKDFALKEFRVRATPVFQFIGLDGEPIKNGRITGATKDADEFMLFGKYVVEKKNEATPFSKFKREQGGDANS